MENHDSEENKKELKRKDEILKSLHLSVEDREKIKSNFDDIIKIMGPLLERKNNGTLTEEDKETLKELQPHFAEVFETLNTYSSLLLTKLFHQSEKQMEHYKKLGEAGNKEAQKIYEDLYKTWIESGEQERGMN